MTYVPATRRSEQGFTLVELAIVMVIIGLLIGGILKGQELIANAKVSSTVAQVKSVDAALNTFFDKYNAYPGDMNNVATRLPNCSGVCATNGNGNTLIGEGDVDNIPAGEETTAFVHMAAADLVSGINQNGGLVFGGQLPTVKAGGGMWVGHTTSTNAPFDTLLPGGRHYIILAGTTTADPSATNGALNASMAAQIDRKLDDGLPNAGSVQTAGTGCDSANTATATYSEGGNAGTCTVFVRALN